MATHKSLVHFSQIQLHKCKPGYYKKIYILLYSICYKKLDIHHYHSLKIFHLVQYTQVYYYYLKNVIKRIELIFRYFLSCNTIYKVHYHTVMAKRIFRKRSSRSQVHKCIQLHKFRYIQQQHLDLHKYSDMRCFRIVKKLRLLCLLQNDF